MTVHLLLIALKFAVGEWQRNALKALGTIYKIKVVAQKMRAKGYYCKSDVEAILELCYLHIEPETAEGLYKGCMQHNYGQNIMEEINGIQ